MNCFDSNNVKEYFETLGSMTKEQLLDEYKKNYYVSNNIKLKYNVLRSRLYLELFEPIDFYLHKTYQYDFERLKKAIQDCLLWCVTYLDTSGLLRSYRVEFLEKIETPKEEKLLEIVKVFCLRVFRHENAFIDLCITAKNHLLYLAKRILDKTSYEEMYQLISSTQLISYEDELAFEDEKEIEKFEKYSGIERKEEINDVVKEVYDSLLLEIAINDKDFQDIYSEDLKNAE